MNCTGEVGGRFVVVCVCVWLRCMCGIYTRCFGVSWSQKVLVGYSGNNKTESLNLSLPYISVQCTQTGHQNRSLELFHGCNPFISRRCVRDTPFSQDTWRSRSFRVEWELAKSASFVAQAKGELQCHLASGLGL